MISRNAQDKIALMASEFPAVLILGPRQCGKTTIAGTVLGTYFDLERPSDYEVFSADPELALARFDAPLILDEAQELPALFSILRSVIDENRPQNGRFYLLGSVNPALVRQVSESLAGRVGMVELTPFLYAEIANRLDGRLDANWLRGGFPEVALLEDDRRRTRWQEQYLQSLVQRDLAGYGLKTSPQEMRRFMGMLAHIHGGLLNASELGRSLGVTYHTIGNHLDILEGHFLIRRLQPWHSNMGKRLVKSPKLYVRDSGLLHYLLGIRSEADLFVSPRRGASWEGFVLEQMIALEQLFHTGSQFWFYRTQAGAEVDLVLERDGQRYGFEFKCAASVSRGDASGLKAGLADGIISRGCIVYAGDRRYPVSEHVEAIPAADLLVNYQNEILFA